MAGFTRAVKTESKLRLALTGPSGSGKTFTALTLAHEIAQGGSVALVDTERGSAAKYADVFPPFDALELDSFHPQQYIDAITEAVKAQYAVLIIDSLSHAWNGTGGMLEIVDGIAKRSKSGNTFNAWGDATPIQNKLIDAITRAPIHIIATMRSKTEHVQERDERTGRTVIRKLGLAPIQRDGVEYEFDVLIAMDDSNTGLVQKSRCPALSNQILPKPGKDTAQALISWLHGAIQPTVPTVPTVPTAPRAAGPPREDELQVAPQQPQQPQQPPASTLTPEPLMTSQQRASIRKLLTALGKEAPQGAANFTFAQARELITTLTAEYHAQQRQAPTAQSSQPMTFTAFIERLNSELALKPPQAMELLGVKTLSNLNLEQAFETLRQQVTSAPADLRELSAANLGTHPN